jgi:hypothetical protein
MVYRSLDASKIVDTAERLARRIKERFPDANLGKVADELVRIARDSVARLTELSRPHLGLRAGVGVLLLGLIGMLGLIFPALRLSWQINAGPDLIQTLDALLESLFFIGGSILFLVTLETRLKRRRALAAVHELRALAHIVDMHQLTKDPEQLLAGGPRTQSSPRRTMTDFELQRYLDYSSELLAIISKIGALYVQGFEDEVVLSAVDDVEDLTNGLSRKIWQKLTILDHMAARRREQATKQRQRAFAPESSGAKRRRGRAATSS